VNPVCKCGTPMRLDLDTAASALRYGTDGAFDEPVPGRWYCPFGCSEKWVRPHASPIARETPLERRGHYDREIKPSARRADCRAAILKYAAAHPHGFFRQTVINALKKKFSPAVIQPVLTSLAKADVFVRDRTRRVPRLFYIPRNGNGTGPVSKVRR
jgi:hypothetical protein